MLEYRRTIAKWTCNAMVTLFFLVLQAMVLPRLSLWGGYPLTAALAVVCVAVLFGSWGGGITGLLCGLTIDAVSTPGEAIFAISFMGAGILVGLLSERYFQKSLWTATVFSLLTIALSEFLYVFIFFYLTGRAGMSLLLGSALPELLWSLAALPVVYMPFRLISLRFAEKNGR